jgi:hypothetical protein
MDCGEPKMLFCTADDLDTTQSELCKTLVVPPGACELRSPVQSFLNSSDPAWFVLFLRSASSGSKVSLGAAANGPNVALRINIKRLQIIGKTQHNHQVGTLSAF